jgi:glyceraldehyde 3-phosphate dehydrogenase
MAVKLGINGFGRIGRLVLRVALKNGVDVAQINDLTDVETMAHLFKYDSIHGIYDGEVGTKDGNLLIDGKEIVFSAIRNPEELPWGKLGVDVVLESTGIFANRAGMEKHIAAGAPRVLLSAPPKDAIDGMIVMGVNSDTLDKSWKLISNASCTTNSLAPVVKVLNDTFGVVKGLMTTIHAYTNDQSILDFPHKDLRRARNGATNIIPTTTGAARAIGSIITELKGKLDGHAIRVPVADGSITDLTVELKKDATKDGINAAVKAAAEGPMKGILQYSDDLPLVSSDIVGNPHSSIFDSAITSVTGGNMAKVSMWYDNEWGFSNRVIDLIKLWV